MIILPILISSALFLYLLLSKKDKLTIYAIGFLCFSYWMIYLDDVFIEKHVLAEYGCIVKRNEKRSGSAYLFINVDGRFRRFSLADFSGVWSDGYVGRCIGFNYYKNMFGRNMIVSFVNIKGTDLFKEE